MAEVPYGIHFHGSDIRDWRQSHTLWRSMVKLIEYRVLKQAKYVAASTPDLITYVRPLRPDSFFIPNPIDFQVFNRSVSKIWLEKAPVFLSPHRMDRTKGHELIWKAISKTRNDFVLLQPDWGWEPYWSRLKKDAPKNVEFIPLIPRSKIASYYISVYGVIGQMNLGVVGMSELEAAACGTPVFCYTNDSSPFLPKSKDPSILAKYIDNLIENRAFRQSLIGNELAYVKERYDAKMVSELWKEKWETIKVTSKKTGRDIIISNIWRKTYFLSHYIEIQHPLHPLQKPA
jgi:glycosyltransferase involved in cell wall biosynthesis